MGLDFSEFDGAAAELYQWASACLGWDLAETLRTASPDELRQTYIAQPAIFCVSVAALRALEAAGVPRPAFVAGHSLGEFSALVAAGALSFEAGLLLVARRAEAMQRAADARPGSMSSVLGLSAEGVEMAVEATAQDQVLAVANDSAPAATRAENSPRECPATYAGRGTPAASSARSAATETQKIAGWAM